MLNLDGLKKILDDGGYTCALTDGNRVITSKARGVRPLADFIASGADFKGWLAADKIVGKAAALLYARLGVAELYAHVLSQAGADVCRRLGIKAECGVIAKSIINRKGDGICPMERAVADVDDPSDAYKKICAALAAIKSAQ